MVQGGGFEPPKLARQIYSLIPLATREPLLESGAYFLQRPPHCQQFFPLISQTYLHILTRKRDRYTPEGEWSWREESNPRPADYKSAALPTELRQHSLTTRELLTSPLSGGGILGEVTSARNSRLRLFLHC